MKLSFLSLYADAVHDFINRGVVGKAINASILDIESIQLRDYSDPPHHKVDDYPFSNRQGMLLRFDILKKALSKAPKNATFVMPDPKGSRFTYQNAQVLAKKQHVYFISPAFEGVDARLFDAFDIQLFSLGDFIIPNGDSAAVLMAEAIVRYLPGVLGCADCVNDDSILSGLLEAPQFCPPRSIDQMGVPDVLLSGHHQEIDRWKLTQSIRRTLYSRPDLMNRFSFNQMLVKIVDQVIMEDIQ